MAGVWKGFTEKDIEFYRDCGKGNDYEDVNDGDSTNKKQDKNSERLVGGKRKTPKYKSIHKNDNFSDVGVPESAKLFKDSEDSNSKSDVKKLEGGTEISKSGNGNGNGNGSETTGTGSENDDKKGEPESLASVNSVLSNPVCLKVIEGKAYKLVERNSTEVSKSVLEIFETRQKKLEEENKKKKEILSKIISIRKKQTSEEAMRLQKIQDELQKLDIRLSNDVGILRDKIEAASLDFAEAQKRYSKAEKEFLDAKQNLLGKLEKKELLTKYLCTIIEQNEMRKSQKLSELMEKLEVNENGKVSENDLKKTIVETMDSSISR